MFIWPKLQLCYALYALDYWIYTKILNNLFYILTKRKIRAKINLNRLLKI